MFFNTEILTKKKGGYAMAWLSATLSASSRARKISKKELLACNVSDECQKIIEPEEPLALRLTGTLMLGVTRIYSGQYTLLYSDATNTSNALRKAIVEVNLPEPRQLTLEEEDGAYLTGAEAISEKGVKKARKAKADINLRKEVGLSGVDLDLRFMDGPFTFQDDAWQQLQDELGRGRAATPTRAFGTPQLEEEYEVGAEREGEEEYIDKAAAKKRERDRAALERRRTAISARPEDITLPAHARGLEEEEELLAGPAPYAEGLEGLGAEMDLDFQLGLEGYEELPPPLRAHEGEISMISTTEGGVPRSPSLVGLPQPHPPTSPAPHEMEFDFGLPMEMGEPAPFRLPGPEGREEEDQAARAEEEEERRRRPSTIPPTPPPSAEKIAVRARKPPKPKVRAPVVDKTTSISLSEIAATKEKYTNEMKSLSESRAAVNWANGERAKARRAIGGGSDAVRDEGLVDFLEKAVGLSDLGKPPKEARPKRPVSPGVPETYLAKKQRREEEEKREREERRREMDGTAEVGRGAAAALPAGPEFEFEFEGPEFEMGGEEAPPYRAPSFIESEIGRERARTPVRIYPWDVGYEEGEVTATTGALPSRRPSISAEGIRLRSPTISPLGRRRTASPAPSLGAIRRPSREPSILGEGPPGAPPSEEVWPGSQATGSEDTQQRALRLERQTGHFVAYAKKNAGPDGALLFSDLVPVATTKPDVAAMAFYHLLVTATKGLIRIKSQMEPYGEIELAVI